MKNLFYAMLVAVAFVLIVQFTPHSRAAQSTYYTDRFGLPMGQAWTTGNQTFYTDAIGRPVGSVATNGSQPAQTIGVPTPITPEPYRIEPIRPIEPIQPLRLQ